MATNAIVKSNGAEIVTIDAQWQGKIELIKRTVANGATNDELEMFLYQCKKSGLDPLARQIHFVKRGGKGTIQTGIDGYRLIADRTGKYAGNDDPVFDDDVKQPTIATVTVWKIVEGQRCPFTARARWTQYYPGDTQGWAWKKMPHVMLGKCAEALALRKAFPAELSGLYTNEEMEQAGGQPSPYIKCEGCGNDILPYTKPDGEVVPEGKVLESGRKRWDMDVCGGCQITMNRAEKEKQALQPVEPQKEDPVHTTNTLFCYVNAVLKGPSGEKPHIIVTYHDPGNGKGESLARCYDERLWDDIRSCEKNVATFAVMRQTKGKGELITIEGFAKEEPLGVTSAEVGEVISPTLKF